jgi:hypothetical protein
MARRNNVLAKNNKFIPRTNLSYGLGKPIGSSYFKPLNHSKRGAV